MKHNRHFLHFSFPIIILLSFCYELMLANNFLPATIYDSIKNFDVVLSADEDKLSAFETTHVIDFQVEDPPKCSKYKKEKRERVVSSTQGLLSDTGWVGLGEFDGDCKNDPPDDSQSCNSETIPGPSLGDDDETITTCLFYKYTCTKNECCEADPITLTASLTLPSWTPLKNAAKAAAESMPMIRKFDIGVSASVSRESGEKCCLKDESEPPVSYKKWSGTVSGNISITLQIPGWGYSFVRNWQGLFRVRAIIRLGPAVKLGPSASVSITGTDFDSCEPKCECCVTTSFSASIGVTISFGGEVTASIKLYFWPYTRFRASAYAEASLGSSIGASGSYNWDICPNPGYSGKVSYGELKGTAKLGLIFKGYDIGFSWSMTLLSGDSITF